jgi:hypothetical protein
MRSELAAVLAVALLAPTGPRAADHTEALARCRAVTDSLQRLMCYDELAKDAGVARPIPAAPTSGSEATAKPASTTTRTEAYSGRCQATTKKGAQCKRSARPGSHYCWQHGG